MRQWKKIPIGPPFTKGEVWEDLHSQTGSGVPGKQMQEAFVDAAKIMGFFFGSVKQPPRGPVS